MSAVSYTCWSGFVNGPWAKGVSVLLWKTCNLTKMEIVDTSFDALVRKTCHILRSLLSYHAFNCVDCTNWNSCTWSIHILLLALERCWLMGVYGRWLKPQSQWVCLVSRTRITSSVSRRDVPRIHTTHNQWVWKLLSTFDILIEWISSTLKLCCTLTHIQMI